MITAPQKSELLAVHQVVELLQVPASSDDKDDPQLCRAQDYADKARKSPQEPDLQDDSGRHKR